MRNTASRLLVKEALGHKSAKTDPLAGFEACDRLRSSLLELMGVGGYRALLLRSLVLASAEIPWLGGLEVNADGSLDEIETLQAELDPKKFYEGSLVLLSALLGLLIAFVGVNLTLRLVQEVWPKVSLSELDFNLGDKNEETKKRGSA
jgi:hypothetical protein